MQILFNISTLSAFYISFSLGLALIFGVMRIINFAHGELFMLGGYTLWIFSTLLRGTIPDPYIFFFALLFAFLWVGLIGLLLQLTLFRALKDAPFAILMATLGLSYIIQVLVVNLIGPSGRSVPTLFPGVIRMHTMILPYQRMLVVVLAFAMVLGLFYLLMHTRTGRAIRAVAQNPKGAALQGINIMQVGMITIALGAALAGAAGVMIGSVNSVNPFMGGEAIWRAFIIIIVGGIGSIPGVILAACMFGTLDTLLAAFGFGKYVAMVDAVVMLAVLTWRPHGLLGMRE